MIHKIVRHFSTYQKVIAFENKAKNFKCVSYVKKYTRGSGNYGCMVCSEEGFTDEVAKELIGKGRNYADLMV